METTRADQVRYFRDELRGWAEEHGRDFPWRDSNASFYEVFLAEFFLTQTPAENVAEVLPKFLDEFPSLSSLEGASVEEVVEIIEPLGLYNRRAEALVDIADRLDGELPRDPDQLEELPRVGPYVAKATVCVALNRPSAIVDTNVLRVYRRLLGEAWTDSEAEQQAIATELLPKDDPRSYNLGLLDLGALVCKPRRPSCEDCFATEACDFYANNGGDGER